MCPIKQKAAIAKYLGAKWHRYVFPIQWGEKTWYRLAFNGDKRCTGVSWVIENIKPNISIEVKFLEYIPDYLNSLEEMQKAWRKLPIEKKPQFYYTLSCVISKPIPYFSQIAPYEIFDATLAQWAEAFLKTVGSWEEE